MRQTRGDFLKVLFLSALSVLTMGSLHHLKAAERNDPHLLLQTAESSLAEGDLQTALATLHRLESALPESETHLRCRLHFLLGETLERKEVDNPSAISSDSDSRMHFEQAMRLDPTPHGAFAVPALLALAKAEPSSVPIQEQLEAAIHHPNLSAHPLVREGIFHRFLAEAVWTEDPRTAIDLLESAREQRGDLEDGTEDLLIASIHRIAFDDPDRAVACYERVLRNGVATRQNREVALREKEAVRSTHIQSHEPPPTLLPEIGAN